MSSQPASAKAADGWQAHMQLRFSPGQTRTRMLREGASGPLYVQKPFYPEGATCHVYLLHPPGGVAGGDCLNVAIRADATAAALITTPAAGKLYRSAGPQAGIVQTISASDDAAVEWLPQETILFGGARASISTSIELHGPARFIGWEIYCLGREASGDAFETGEVLSTVALERDGVPVLQERQSFANGAPGMNTPWGLAGRRVVASLYATPADAELARILRRCHPARTAPDGHLLSAATLIDGVLVYRVLGSRSDQVRAELMAVWRTLRPLVLGRKVCPPRIWST